MTLDPRDMRFRIVVGIIVAAGISLPLILLYSSYASSRRLVALISNYYGHELSYLRQIAEDFVLDEHLTAARVQEMIDAGEMSERFFHQHIGGVMIEKQGSAGIRNVMELVGVEYGFNQATCWLPRSPQIGSPVANLYVADWRRYVEYREAVPCANGTIVNIRFVLCLRDHLGYGPRWEE